MNANNLVSLTGNLTRDVEVKDVGGSKVAKFSLAVNRFFKKNGEKVEQASFFDCELWGDQVDVMESYTKKGSKISIVGEAVQDVWEQDGQKRSKVYFRVDNFQLRDKKEAKVGTATDAPQTTSDSTVPF